MIRVKEADGVFCVYRLEFERQQREELEKLELKRYKSKKLLTDTTMHSFTG